MVTALKNEIYKLYKSRGLRASVLLSLLIIIGDTVFAYFQYAEGERISEKYYNGLSYPAVLCNYWIGDGGARVFNKLYYFLIPIIAVLPFAVTYYTEIRTGYMKNVCTRIRRRYYVAAKYITAAVSGGLACAVPLMLNVWAVALFVPNYISSPTLMLAFISNRDLFSEIYYTHPLAYIFIHIGLAFLYGGLFAAFAMSFVYLARNMFIYAMFPFLIDICAYYVLSGSYTGIRYVPSAFLNPTRGFLIEKADGMITVAAVLMILAIIAAHRQTKKDILI